MKKGMAALVVAFALVPTEARPALSRAPFARWSSAPVRSHVRPLTADAAVIERARVPGANWTVDATSLSVAVMEVGGGAFAGRRVYAPGGYIDLTPTLLDQMQIRGVRGGSWTLDPDHLSDLTGLPGVADAAVCADGAGDIHVINGTLDGTAVYSSHLLFTPTAPAGEKWSVLAPPSVDGNAFASQDSGCAFLNGRIYLFGGYGVVDPDPSPTLVRLTWSYDAGTDTWTDTGFSMITGRLWMGYTASSRRVFVAGGTDDLSTFLPTASAETFTRQAGWSALADLPAGRIGAGMGMLGSTVAVFGGRDSAFVLIASTVGCTAGACQPGPWTDLNKVLNTPRWLTAWATGEGRLYDAGGADSSGAALATSEWTA